VTSVLNLPAFQASFDCSTRPAAKERFKARSLSTALNDGILSDSAMDQWQVCINPAMLMAVILHPTIKAPSDIYTRTVTLRLQVHGLHICDIPQGLGYYGHG
jgi:hypothetical protein